MRDEAIVETLKRTSLPQCSRTCPTRCLRWGMLQLASRPSGRPCFHTSVVLDSGPKAPPLAAGWTVRSVPGLPGWMHPVLVLCPDTAKPPRAAVHPAVTQHPPSYRGKPPSCLTKEEVAQ